VKSKKNTLLVCALALALFWLGQSAHAQPVDSDLSASLQASIQPLIDAHEGQVAVAIKHFDSHTTYLHQAQRPMPTASLIKFPLMIVTFQAVQEGKLNFADRITLREEDKVPGSGILTADFSAGTTFSLRDAVGLMIAHSDNTATNLVIDQVGLEATTALMEKLGCPDTKLHSKVFRRDTSIAPERSRKFGLGSTSAADLLKLLELLQQRKLVSDTASQQMFEILLTCDDTTRLTRLLPTDIRVAHKTGSVSAVRTAAGLIESPAGSIAVCVLTSENEDRRWSSENAGNRLCAQVALAAYRCFNPDANDLPPAAPVVLSEGASGKLVEALQRTLNARLKPSPDIGVDGDFGPQTLRTVLQFQQANSLEATGQVDAATWKALGTLETEDRPVPDPEVVNREKLPRQPPDPSTGPPFVTCQAWAIVDGKTGQFLWGEQADEPLDMASTTKIMTGLLVVRLAKANPNILNETVTFSQRADETSGSTTGILAGEQISVGELLYGLLLPSGNDASVALGEHFGPRLADPPQPDADPLELFIQAMNAQAQALELETTSFKNTHGITAAGHHTSAHDLAKLTWHAMQQPLFARTVQTRQHGTTVTGPGGYRKNLLWKNTNRLLATSGYDGIKTGTTSAAGSCLVSRCHQKDQTLLAVVLGSSSSDARYVDTRNLYRWAWKQLARGGGK
jgi:D-alanyl-D-alanine carboxypeptidase (penicillin-binding protein 5/6)